MARPFSSLDPLGARAPTGPPTCLDAAGIAARVPHGGRMCLLDRMLDWSAEHIHCSAGSHTDPANPLRCEAGLLAPAAIEYAAQAMALHGTLSAALRHSGAAPAPLPGFLASARNVRLWVPRLDRVAGPLTVRAQRLRGDARQALYCFEISDEHGAPLVDGRATVVFDTALPTPSSAQHHE